MSAVVGEQTAALTERTDALALALEVAGDRLDPVVADQAAATVARVRARLELGVDHTIVALVGGTGSGKSTLFNAVSGLMFAEVGVRRPTTSEVTACVWGGDATALLDWLGVSPDRRIQRESALDGETEAPLRGLVLLDLPDHDSIAPEHRDVVDRLLPQADLLAWVVDPQKYADDALHTGYLQRLVGRESSMVVVLNQIDTVPVEQRAELVEDVDRLLVADGLTGVAVRVASARTLDGVTELRDALAGVVAEQSLAARRAQAELAEAAEAVRAQVAERDPAPAALATNEVVDALASAAGLPAVASAVEAGVGGAYAGTRPFGPVSRDAAALVRGRWLATATAALPGRWASDADARAASAEELGASVVLQLAEVPVDVRRSRLAVGLLVVAALAGLAAVGLVVAGAVEGGDGAAASFVGAAIALVVGVAAWLCARAARRAAARRRAATVLRDGRAAVERAVASGLVAPVRDVVDEQRRIRELVTQAGTSD